MPYVPKAWAAGQVVGHDDLNHMETGIQTAQQAAEAAMPKGVNNQSISEVLAMVLAVDTRSTVLTYTAGKLTQVQEKDGATVVRTTTLNYTGDTLTSVVETANGRTITTTLNYTGSTLTSVTRAVV